MGFQLSNDEENTSSGSKYHTYHTDEENLSDLELDDSESIEDPFAPDEEDTVFIADQYNRATSDTPISLSATSSAKSYKINTFPPILMLISAGLNILTMILIMIRLKNGVADIETFTTLVSSYSGLTFVSEIILIVDAIILCCKGNGFGLILWAIFLPVVYYFKRCKANGNPSTMATIIILAMLVIGAFYVKSTYESLLNMTGLPTSNTSSSDSVASLDDQIAQLSRAYITYEGKYYYYDKIIAGNIDSPSYKIVEGTPVSPTHLSVTGTTTLNGKVQDIEIRINSNNFNIQGITIGSKNHTSEEDINTILQELFKNTETR